MAPPSAAVARKKLPSLDEHASRFAARARLVAFAAPRSSGHVEVGARARPAALTVADPPSTLWIADTVAGRVAGALDAMPSRARAATLLLVPGLGETLRVNGRASHVRDPEALARAFGAGAPPAGLRIEVEESFFHCAKALRRSDFWGPLPDADGDDGQAAPMLRGEALGPAHRAFLARCRFALLATRDADGHLDVSPRGDAGEVLRVVDSRTLLLPDRPGNRLLDSARNALADGRVAVLALVPGAATVLRLCGRATPTRDGETLQQTAAGSRVPPLGLRIEIEEVALERRASPLGDAWLWDPSGFPEPGEIPSLGRVFARQAGARGVRAALLGRAIDAALRRDERRNLE